MVAQGHVKNGVVVLANGVRLPEGQEVTVLAPGASPGIARSHGILNIAPVSLHAALRPLTDEDDLLDKMLEGRS